VGAPFPYLRVGKWLPIKGQGEFVQGVACALEKRGPRKDGVTEYGLPPTPFGAATF